MPPDYLGVSTGRAGSTFIARVMNRAGIRTLHEQHFIATRFEDGRPKPWDRDARGEWSAQAVPFLDDYDCWVFHQVRHPLRVIDSYLHFGLFANPIRFGRQGRFMAEHAGITGGNPLGELVRFYVDWNRRCERPRRYKRWRVEDVSPSLIVKLGGLLGVDVPVGAAAVALDEVPTDTNTRRPEHSLTWDDLPDTGDTLELMEMAGRYGYL